MLRLLRILAASLTMVCAASGRVSAQSDGRFYIGGGIGAFRVDADEVNGTSAAISVLGGIAVNRWLDLELDVALPASPSTRTYGGDALNVSFAPADPTRRDRGARRLVSI